MKKRRISLIHCVLLTVVLGMALGLFVQARLLKLQRKDAEETVSRLQKELEYLKSLPQPNTVDFRQFAQGVEVRKLENRLFRIDFRKPEQEAAYYLLITDWPPARATLRERVFSTIREGALKRLGLSGDVHQFLAKRQPGSPA